jgi:prevent-host-death family protein
MHDMKVTTADFIKNFGQLSDKALSEPVTITKNGRDRLVVLSVDEYERLKRRDRQVILAENAPSWLIEAFSRTDDIPAECHALNAEAKDCVA